jgi:putative transposase
MRKDSFGYRHGNHSVGLATVHLVWIPKRRKPVLRGDIKLRLATILESVATDRGWIIKAFKGRSSKLLRDDFPDLKKLPSLWTRSYFYDTSGKVSTAKVLAYINDPHHERH